MSLSKSIDSSTVIIECSFEGGAVWPGYWAFAGLLVALQCLHVFWFCLILKMAWRLLFSGESIEKDVRSDDDDLLLEEEDHNNSNQEYSKTQKID